MKANLLGWMRAYTALKQVKKQDLARKCEISPPLLSQYIHGYAKMPRRVRDIILEELGLRDIAIKQGLIDP